MPTTGDGATPHRIVRSLLILLGGVVGVVLGLTILTALAKPAGAASLPVTPAIPVPAVSVPAVSVPPVTVPAVSMPAVSVPPVTVPAVSLPAVSTAGTQLVTSVASLAQVPKNAPTGLPGSPGGIPGAVATTTHSLAAPVIAAGRTVADPLTAGLGVPTIPFVGGSSFGADGTGATPPPVVGGSPTLWDGDASVTGAPIYALAALAPRPGSANPSPAPRPLAPHPVPPSAPYPATNSFLAMNDVSGDSGVAQGGSPFGTVPPLDLVPPVLALGGVLLLHGTRPRLLLDSRCSPPG